LGGATIQADGASNAVLTFSAATAKVGITKAQAGTWTLSGLNTLTGDVTICAGTLVAGSAGNGTNSSLGGIVSTRIINVNTGGSLLANVAGGIFNNNFASAATSLPALNIAGGTMTNGGTATNSALGSITLVGGTLTATVGSGFGYGLWNLNGTVTSTGTSTISSSAAVPITLSSAAGTTTLFDVQSGTLTASAVIG